MVDSGDRVKRHPGRSGWAWEKVRAQVLASSSVCWLCGRQLDFDAPPRSKWSPSVDHLVPLKTLRGMDPVLQREIALDARFLRPAHYACNSRRGARRIPPQPPPRRQSREW